jgi:hypothetical protein
VAIGVSLSGGNEHQIVAKQHYAHLKWPPVRVFRR